MVGGDDCRTLGIDYDEHGERFKRWRGCSREMKFHRFEDWPFEDSNSQTLYLASHWDRHGEDGQVWLERWMTDRGISPGERTGIEMKTLVQALHLGGTYDQLNLPSLASFEFLSRRSQLILEAHAHDAHNPDYSNSDYMAGTTREGDVVCPTLVSTVAEKMKDSAGIDSNRHKVRELRSQNDGPKGGTGEGK